MPLHDGYADYEQQKRDDDYGRRRSMITTGGWAGIGLQYLLLLAAVALSAAVLGIVVKNEHKWKGIGASSSEEQAVEHSLLQLEKQLDWVKKDLGGLDNIERQLWWIKERLDSSGKRSWHGSEWDSSSEESESSEEDWRRKDRNGCCRVRRGEQLLFCDPFDGTQGVYNPATSCPYFFFADPTVPYVADDGVISQSFKKGVVVIDSMPYTKTIEKSPQGGTDHVKYLNLLTIAAAVNEWQRVRYTLTMSCETDPGDYPFPSDLITDANKDIRLACCAINGVNFETFLVLDWIMTGPTDGSEGVKGCFYEVLPAGRDCSDPSQPECYRAFSSYNITGTRYKDDVEELSIEYDREKGEARWYDKGKLVCSTGNLGTPNPGFVLRLDHGGNDRIVDPSNMNFGFGNFDLLDMADFLNPDSDTGLVMISSLPNFYVLPCETCFFDTQSLLENRIFGQGAKFTAYQSLVTVSE